jgi:acetyl esterase/lipase
MKPAARLRLAFETRPVHDIHPQESAAMEPISRRRFIETTGLAAVAPLAGESLTEAAQTQGAQNGAAGHGAVAVEKNVSFGKGGDMELRLDIYRPPAGTEKRMATIHIHGGGFTGGSKDTLSERVPPYASRGYVGLAVQYRLAGQAKWPAQIEDVKAAIRWARANAKSLGVDPDRIGVVGHSAGGHLALFAAGTANRSEFEGKGGTPGVSTQVIVCCAYYPATEVNPRPDGTANNLMPPGSDAAAHRAASPITYVAAGFPPTVIFHGTADTTIPIASSERLFKMLRDAKVPAEFHGIEGVPHVFDSNREFAESAAAMADFFIDRHVIHPRTWGPPAASGGGRGGRQ